jgi:hypothetical protein
VSKLIGADHALVLEMLGVDQHYFSFILADGELKDQTLISPELLY